MSVDVILVIEIVTEDKNETRISTSVGVKIQQDVTHVKMRMPEILVHVLASITKIVKLVNT